MLLAVGSNRLATKLKAYETPTWLKITRLTPTSGSNFDTDYSVEPTQEPKIAAPKA